MKVSTRIGYRAKATDEKILLALAEHLERDISDTLRFAVRHTAREYGLLPKKKPPVIKQNGKRENLPDFTRKGGD